MMNLTEKTIKVVESCKTPEQLKVAEVFASRAVNIISDNASDCLRMNMLLGVPFDNCFNLFKIKVTKIKNTIDCKRAELL